MSIDVGSAVGYLMLDTSNFNKGITSALSDLKTLTDNTASVSDKFTAVGTALSSVGTTLTKSVTVPLVGVGTAAVATATSFESAMSQVQATMGITKDSMSDVHGETVNTMDALEDIAKEMGEKTAFSAKEAAEALNYLALAGYSTEEQIDALPSVLTLASAGNMDLAYASDLVTDSMSVLGLTTDDLSGYIDKMAKTASSSNTSVSQLGEAVLVAGGQATLCGMNTTELNTALGILADNGIKGSEGGTMLRNVLKNLYTPTDTARKAMEDLGITTSNADGSLRDTQDVLQDLSGALSGLTDEERVQAMADIFDTRTISGANALINNCTDRWDELSAAIDDSADAAQLMADTQLDNLSGQLTILKSGLEGAAIAFGDLLLPMIKDVIQVIQNVVDWINNLSDGQKQMIVTIAEVAAAVGPVLLILGKVMTSVGGLISTISTLGSKMSTISSVLGGLGTFSAPILAVVAAVVALVAAFKNLWDTNDEFRESILNTWQTIKDTVSGFIDGIIERLDALGIDFQGVSDTLSAIWNGFCELLAPVFEGAFNEVATILETVLGVITGIFDIFIGVFTGNWDQAWTGVQEVFGSIWDGIKDTFSNKINIIKGIADTICNWFGTTWNDVWEGIKEFFIDIWNEIVEFFSTLPETIGKIVDEVVEWFEGLPERIAYWLGYAWGKIVTWVTDTKNTIQTEVPKIIEKVVNYFKELPGKIWTWLKEAINKVVTWGTETKEKASAAMSDFLDKVTEWLKKLPGQFQEWFEKALDYLRGLPDTLKQIGKDIFNGLWSGLKSVWDSISSWIDGVVSKIKSIFSSASQGYSDATSTVSSSSSSRGGVTGYIAGSYASGLDYVPRDMNVRVHEGEAILTKQENANKGNSGGDTYNFYSPTALTPTKAAQEFKRVKQELALGYI